MGCKVTNFFFNNVKFSPFFFISAHYSFPCAKAAPRCPYIGDAACSPAKRADRGRLNRPDRHAADDFVRQRPRRGHLSIAAGRHDLRIVGMVGESTPKGVPQQHGWATPSGSMLPMPSDSVGSARSPHRGASLAKNQRLLRGDAYSVKALVFLLFCTLCVKKSCPKGGYLEKTLYLCSQTLNRCTHESDCRPPVQPV